MTGLFWLAFWDHLRHAMFAFLRMWCSLRLSFVALASRASPRLHTKTQWNMSIYLVCGLVHCCWYKKREWWWWWWWLGLMMTTVAIVYCYYVPLPPPPQYCVQHYCTFVAVLHCIINTQFITKGGKFEQEESSSSPCQSLFQFGRGYYHGWALTKQAYLQCAIWGGGRIRAFGSVFLLLFFASLFWLHWAHPMHTQTPRTTPTTSLQSTHSSRDLSSSPWPST